jgi:predicted restriction endonuclease
MMFFGDETKKRTSIGKTEWESIKARHKNRCCICERTEKSVGILEKAHVKAHSRGGTQYFPLCPTCHTKYDKGLLTLTELKKLGITKETYERLKPQKPVKKKDSNPWF